MGPTKRIVTALTANATADPIESADWIYRRLPWAAMVEIALVATTANVVYAVVIGADEQAQESPVPAGGVAGVYPKEVADFDQFLGAAGDQIRIRLRETGGAVATVNTVVKLTQL